MELKYEIGTDEYNKLKDKRIKTFIVFFSAFASFMFFGSLYLGVTGNPNAQNSEINNADTIIINSPAHIIINGGNQK